MDEQEQTKNPILNPNQISTRPNSTKKRTEVVEYEFCKVCNLNHDQGKRHKYFPNHAKARSSYLSRFRAKLSDIKFFIKNPTLLLAEYASCNRLWCVFCDCDIDELGSSFACAHAIAHLASTEHLKNLKKFLWKYGGGMDCVDSFRVSEADLVKWEKKCNSMEMESVSSNEALPGVLIGPLNDIHNQLSYEKNVDNFDENAIPSVNSSFSNSVVPLQNYTCENYQIPSSRIYEVAQVGYNPNDIAAFFHIGTSYNCITVYKHGHPGLLFTGQRSSADVCLNNGGEKQLANEESMSQGRDEAMGNVHSGAPPPWFEASGSSQMNIQLRPGGPILKKQGKSVKLNPKRVGAAWAERRKMELEMEKRGEIVSNIYDDSWLPNFGRVWQSGSRKASRMEFEMEKQKSYEIERQPEIPIKIEPYISKRMRRDPNDS